LTTINQALRESEEKYRNLVERANDGICIVQDEKLKYVNPGLAHILGYTMEELTGSPFVDYFVPEEAPKAVDYYKRRMAGEDIIAIYETTLRHKNGSRIDIEINAGITTYMSRPADFVFIRDITQRKRLEDQFQQAQKMEAVGTLAGGIAHDFNNLLQAIQGYSDLLLLDKNKDEPGYRDLQEIRHAGQRASELTQQLLTFSQKVESKLRPVDLNHEVAQVEKLLKRIIPKMIKIELHLADTLSTINADPSQIEQVIMNLGVNARDAMPEGGELIIETEKTTMDEEYCNTHLGATPGDYVLLTVSDTGHGMDKDILEHIFEPFYTTKKTGKGTGLGLAMVYGIIKGHQGYITCYSEPGEGTAFKIYLPTIEQEAESEELKEEKMPVGGTETILLVDDEQSIRELGKDTLAKFGYKVIMAPDGESALELYREKKKKIDLIILDLIMPGMGGRKCLEKLLKINPQVKALIASGYSVNEPTKEALEAGARGFISKPYDLKQMLKAVRKALDKD